jgi:hypothetical protein
MRPVAGNESSSFIKTLGISWTVEAPLASQGTFFHGVSYQNQMATIDGFKMHV